MGKILNYCLGILLMVLGLNYIFNFLPSFFIKTDLLVSSLLLLTVILFGVVDRGKELGFTPMLFLIFLAIWSAVMGILQNEFFLNLWNMKEETIAGAMFMIMGVLLWIYTYIRSKDRFAFDAVNPSKNY